MNIEATRELQRALGIVFLQADWTTRDDEIRDVMRALGFASVPLTAIFPGRDPNAPILLDGVFGPKALHAAMREAVNR